MLKGRPILHAPDSLFTACQHGQITFILRDNTTIKTATRSLRVRDSQKICTTTAPKNLGVISVFLDIDGTARPRENLQKSNHTTTRRGVQLGGFRPIHTTAKPSLDVEGNVKPVLDGDRQQHCDASLGPELRRVLARPQLRGDDEGWPFSRAGAERVHVGRTNVDALGSLLLAFHRLGRRVRESSGARQVITRRTSTLQQT